MKKFSKSIGIAILAMIIGFAMTACKNPAGGGKEESTYTVTMQSDDNGTASASKTAEVAEGETVTITATPNAKRFFKQWQVVSGGASLAGTTAAETTFTMPASNVTIKANFFSPFGDWADDADAPTVTFTLTEGSGSDSDTFLMETEVIPGLGIFVPAYEGTLTVDTAENEINFTATHSYTGTVKNEIAEPIQFTADLDVGEGELSFTFQSIQYTLSQTDIPDVAPTISTTSLPDGTAGTAYSQTLTAIGTAPITWTIESGALPAGLNLAADTGVISGTPTTTGTAEFTVKAANAAGNDTAELSIEIAPNIIEITNQTELAKIGVDADYPLNGNYKVMNNIPLTGTQTPIGSWSETNDSLKKAFTGIFDGNGKTISGLNIDDGSSNYQGLFAYIGEGGTVKNLVVSGTVVGDRLSGGIAGENLGTISGVGFSGEISGGNAIGGIAGRNRGTIEHSYNTADVTGTAGSVGGITGFNMDAGTISFTYNTGTIIGTEYVGGIVGYGGASTVSNNISLGLTVTASEAPDRIGRIIGDGSGTGNKARSDMKVNGSVITNGTASNMNGADVIVGSDTTQVNVFGGWDSAIWNIIGNLDFGADLPTLKAAVQSPAPTVPGTAAPVITGVSAGTATIAAAGGTSVITVAGTNLVNGITVTAFDGVTETTITGTTNGSGTSQTVTLTFPANTSTADKVYTVKASLDGGSTWEAQTATVTVSKSLTSITADETEIDAAGGTITITITGINFTNSIRLGIFEGTTRINDNYNWPSGTSVSRTIDYTFPKNTTAADKVYTVKFSPDSSNEWMPETLTVTVLKPVQGQEGNPFGVNSAAALRQIGSGTDGWGLDKHYTLTADISITGTTAIIASYNNGFTGTFDGNGHTITLTINGTAATNYVGLFADIAEGGIVRNLHVTGTIKGGWHVGSIASVNHGTIENSYFDGTVEGVVNATTGGQNVGGLVGLNIGGSVRNCYNTGTITGQSMIGGIAGWNDASVTYCYNTGIIEGTGDYIGGIAGINTGSIQRSVSLGAASAKSSGITAISGIGRVAGTADYSGDTGSLAVCYANKTMKVNGSNVTVQVAANARNGADITSTEWSDPAWWTGTTGVRWNSYGDTNWDFSGIGASSYPKLTVFQ